MNAAETKTTASKALATAPAAPVYYSPEDQKAAYRGHFTALGGVATKVDVASWNQRPNMRRAWVFPDGSRMVSDWAS
jgi:hypothetical protein